MTTDATHVILGATLAGAKAAEALREEGFDGRIVLLGAEEHRPRATALSKAYLAGAADRDTVFVHPAEWYDERRIDLRLGVAATGLDRITHEVVLAAACRTPSCC
jgi:3-phenylpropionate/trans-cinnamate dioxygenase ferredoxin reductase subunit